MLILFSLDSNQKGKRFCTEWYNDWATGWMVGVRILIEARLLSVLQSFQTDFGAHTAFCVLGTGFLCQGWSGRDVKLITHIHLLPQLRIGGAKPLLLLFAFFLISYCIQFWFVTVVRNCPNFANHSQDLSRVAIVILCDDCTEMRQKTCDWISKHRCTMGR